MTDDEAIKQRLKNALDKIIEADDGSDTASANGPVRSPVDRFAHLPESTRKWIEELRQEDLDDLDAIIIGYRGTRTIVKFFKWFLISLVGGFVAAWALGEKIFEILKKLRGA